MFYKEIDKRNINLEYKYAISFRRNGIVNF